MATCVAWASYLMVCNEVIHTWLRREINGLLSLAHQVLLIYAVRLVIQQYGMKHWISEKACFILRYASKFVVQMNPKDKPNQTAAVTVWTVAVLHIVNTSHVSLSRRHCLTPRVHRANEQMTVKLWGRYIRLYYGKHCIKITIYLSSFFPPHIPAFTNTSSLTLHATQV